MLSSGGLLPFPRTGCVPNANSLIHALSREGVALFGSIFEQSSIHDYCSALEVGLWEVTRVPPRLSAIRTLAGSRFSLPDSFDQCRLGTVSVSISR